MGTDARTRVVIDTSTLVNFLRIDRVDLLAGLPAYRFVVTDHVRGELRASYPEQLAIFEYAMFAGHFDALNLDDRAELAVFAEFQALRLGAGECACIAAAISRGLTVAIDDRRARNQAIARHPEMRLLDTVALMVEAIRAGLLTIAEADGIKRDWEANHRFIKRDFTSFGELFA